MKGKIKILCLILFISKPLLCSYTTGNVILEWHSFRHAITVSTGKDAGGLGHSFLKIKNNSNRTATIGHYALSSGSDVTIGLWTSGVLGSSSSSDSSLSGFNEGILYNYEQWYYCTYEKTQDDIYTTYSMDADDRNRLSDLLIKKNSNYSLITYNFATFTTDAWNIVTGSDYWTGWNRTPSSVMSDIREYTYYNGNTSLNYSPYYYYYDENKGTMVRV